MFDNNKIGSPLLLNSMTSWSVENTLYPSGHGGICASVSSAYQVRTIATEWHTDYRLPTKITEPGKITEYTYDGQGQPLNEKMRSIQ